MPAADFRERDCFWLAIMRSYSRRSFSPCSCSMRSSLVRVVFQLSRNCLRSDELSAMHSVASTTNSNESEAKDEPSSSGTPYHSLQSTE